MLHDPYTLFSFIQSPYQYVVQYTAYRAPRNAVFSIILWIYLRCSAHFFSAVFSDVLNAYSFLIWRDKLHTHIDQEEVL